MQKRYFLIIITLLLFAFNNIAKSQTRSLVNKNQPNVDISEAVNFTATDINGVEWDLYDILDNQNKYVALFFHMHNEPDINVVPYLQETYEYFGCGQSEIQFFGVNYNNSNNQCIAFNEENGINFPTFSGNNGSGSEICSAYNVGYFPMLKLIAPDHEILEQDIWPIPNSQTVIDIFEAYGLEENNCVNSDSLALVAFYNATNGDSWTNNTNWLTDVPLNEWFGITTNAEGRVTHIHLSENNLIGSLPIEIGNLNQLVELQLSYNEIEGSIPNSIGNYANIEEISISNNQLSGQIPNEIGNLISLKSLVLSSNEIEGIIPSEIGNLVNLHTLSLSTNNLSGTIPLEIGNCTNLSAIWLGNNQLTNSIPTEIGNLINLWQLNLNENQLSGEIPPSLSNLTSLQILSLYDNHLSGTIPAEIGQLTDLHTIFLQSNQLTGSIPPEIGLLTNLYRLELNDNELSGSIPIELSNLSDIGMLRLQNNQLSGSIPESLCNSWPSLFRLKLEGNLFGNENCEIINCFEERNLSVFTHSPQTNGFEFNSDCQGSTIEDQRNALIALYNATDGDNWTNSENWLSDEPLDEWFGVNTDLDENVTAIVLGYNNLNGYLPSEIGNLVYLDSLFMHGNSLHGNIPVEIGNLSMLKRLILFENQLSGNIPTEISYLTDLLNLALNSNQLSGNIPNEIGNLSVLTQIDFSDNQLIGEIPIEIYNLYDLSYLGLSNNNLDGEISPEIGNLVELHNLALGNNNFSGEIPSEICNLNNLWDLWLNDNMFYGSLPMCIQSFSNLYVVHFENNNFNLIPQEFSNMEFYYSNFSGNDFTFEDLFYLPSNSYYNPQNTIHAYDTAYLSVGQVGTIQLSFDNEVQNSTYNWYLEGTLIATTNDNYLETVEELHGTYYYNLEITNTEFPDFTLEVDSVIVIVEQNDISFTKQHTIRGDSSLMWGDYNNDGFLDLLLNDTYSYFHDKYTRIYKNYNADSLDEVLHNSIQGVTHSSTTWGDYNNDSFLDIMVTGWINHGNRYFSMLYQNNGDGSFTAHPEIDIEDVSRSHVDWSDFNNDGYRDFALSGYAQYGIGNIIKIYKNQNGSDFEELDLGFPVLKEGTLEWGDYNNDGFLDLLFSGEGENYNRVIGIYKNNGNESFTSVENINWTDNPGHLVKWGDYNNDGLLDAFVGGFGGLKVFYNQGNDNFQLITEIEFDMVDFDLGDIDNDGNLDIILGAWYNDNSSVFINNADHTFSLLSGVDFPYVGNGSVELGDFDNDNDLDIALASWNNTETSGIYINISQNPNNPPSAPTGLSAEIINDSIYFTWNRSTDNETPPLGLSYNIMVGSQSGGFDLNSPQSDPETGFHRIAHRGMIQDTFLIMKLPQSIESFDYVYWSVQSIDNGLLASEFSNEDSVQNLQDINTELIIESSITEFYPYQSFITEIEMEDVVDLASVNFNLHYISEYIEPINYNLSDFLTSSGRTISNYQISEGEDEISIQIHTEGEGIAGPQGDGVIMEIEWISIQQPEVDTNLLFNFQSVLVQNTIPDIIDLDYDYINVLALECFIHDIDCDCDVDIVDISSAAYTYGTQQGDENYDSRFDFDNDGDIDIIDITTIAYNYGWNCSN